jgi:opacity protein-like surface antigen
MKQNNKKYPLSTKLLSLIFAIGLVFMCSSAYCQEDCEKVKPAEDKWQFEVTPLYINANSLDLDSTVAGTTTVIDLDISDVFDDFDVWGVAALFEARKGKSKWSILFNGSYINLNGDFNLKPSAPAKVKVDIEQAIVDLAVSYRLFRGLPMKKQGCYLPLSLDVWAGGRYVYLKQEISPNLEAGISTKLGTSKDWVEPLVGARIQFCLTKKLTFNAHGNVSGFGVGSASDTTWDFTTGFDFRLTERTSIKLAYRIYDIDYSNGSGTEEFGLDGKIEGPWLGMTLHF